MAIAILLVVIALAGCGPSTTKVVSKAKADTPVQISATDTSPPSAQKHKRTLIAASRSVWGLNAPTPTFAAQVHQESAWNEQARSPVGAQGLAQFMPATADWIDDAYPDLGPNQPYNPTWALSALVRYDKHLWDRVEGKVECDHMAFTLAAYNGGEKWVQRDKALASSKGEDPSLYWGSVEKYNGGRHAAAFQENRGYPPRILKTLQPKYASWGRVIPC